MTLPVSPRPEKGFGGLCAIHQPNFFPWLGYFDKIRRADTFVFIDSVDYPRSGSGGMGSWSNRVRVNVKGEAHWIGAPIRRVSLGTPIREVLFDDRQPWREKLLKTLDQSYRKAPGRGTAMGLLEPIIRYPEGRLADFNIHAITTIAKALGFTARYLRQSELSHEGAATALLVSLVKSASCGMYLSGAGAASYQKDAMFEEAGIQLVYQDFNALPYGDQSAFLPGLSIIDYLMQVPDCIKGPAS